MSRALALHSSVIFCSRRASTKSGRTRCASCSAHEPFLSSGAIQSRLILCMLQATPPRKAQPKVCPPRQPFARSRRRVLREVPPRGRGHRRGVRARHRQRLGARRDRSEARDPPGAWGRPGVSYLRGPGEEVPMAGSQAFASHAAVCAGGGGRVAFAELVRAPTTAFLGRGSETVG